ncbi:MULTISPECIES: TolC family protein [Prochlorococcus]|uniref:TolC family protein n=1 Tax=Prochlorococcus TaxID=1218 RepID=UPI0007B3C927|nr:MULTISPECIES: TolC family protein [Prochlorococcus]KZR79200.1 outer membrane channel protein [Prochlorococcus marinus str. MIT 1327]NMO83977.1 TolC family protein [Prochlorococcus sp. P1344]NMP06970.1 TolC family protein [Prochlorococcus sp. P1361]KZR65299.1 outer membrane channel protein [Prochlorococcus marinus str. MIT 1312]NMP12813.1 TolC family protein [Prochlorococcus sp.P1363]
MSILHSLLTTTAVLQLAGFWIVPQSLAQTSKSNEILASKNANYDSTHLANELNRLQNIVKQNSVPISLDKAIVIGITNNPELLQAFGSIQQYEWSLIAAQRRWYPQLQLSNGSPFIGYSWGTYINNQYGMRGNRDSSTTLSSNSLYSTKKNQSFLLQPGAIVSWNFIDPTRKPDINAVSESLKQQKLLFNVSTRSLILNLQQSYYGIQSGQQLINSFKQIYEINKQQLKMLEAQKNIGMATVLDVEQTKSQLFTQLSQLVSYTQEYIKQTALLAEYLALPPGQLAIPSDPAALAGSWSETLQETLKNALQQREEILASLAAAESAQWRGIASIRSYLPVFQLMGTGSLNFSNGYPYVPVDDDPGSAYHWTRTWTATVGIGFSWSLFDGGINAANAQSFYAQSRQQKAQAAQTELTVVRQVRNSFAEMQTSRVAIASAQRAYESAKLAQEVARVRWAAGVGDITSVVQTIQQLSIAAQQSSQAILSYNNAVAELYRYSATWPGSTEKDVQMRLRMMRNPSSNPKNSSLMP